MEQLFLTKYKISTGECFEPNYYDAIPESDGIHAYTEDLPTENYIKKHYNAQTGEFYEGATQQELVDYWKPRLNERLINAFVLLIKRAKASSMQKHLNPEYQQCLEEVYKLKYDVTSGAKSRPYVQSLLEDEAENDFAITLDYATYSGMVTGMWDNGQLIFDNFIAMVERGRSAGLTALERDDIDKAKQIVELMENVPEQLTEAEAQALTADLLTLAQRPD